MIFEMLFLVMHIACCSPREGNREKHPVLVEMMAKGGWNCISVRERGSRERARSTSTSLTLIELRQQERREMGKGRRNT